MSAPTYPHAERDLALRLGVAQKQLRTIRGDDLQEKIDWQIARGVVRYSEAGLAKLLKAIGVGAEDPKPAPEKIAAEEPVILAGPCDTSPSAVLDRAQENPKRPPGTIEELKVRKVYKINRKMLEALTSDGELVVVRVKDNANFVAGMAMRCRLGKGRVWEFTGRIPRRRGRY